MRIVPSLVFTLFLVKATQLPSQICEVAHRSFQELLESKTICKTTLLDPVLCETGVDYIKKGDFLTFPRAGAGSLPVYIADKIVIKAFNQRPLRDNPKRESSQSRQKNEIEASRIIEEKGYHRLILPPSCSYEGHLINEKLPIMNEIDADILYRKYPEAFTEAVEQFSRFIFQRPMTDIHFSNVVPYLVQEGDQWIGQLGLVDVEHFSLTDEFNSEMITVLLTLFPAHYQQIVDLAKKLPLEFKEEVLIRSVRHDKYVYLFGQFLEEEDISLEIREKVLVEAASSNRLDIVERLLEGKDISVEAKERALFHAVSSNRLEMVERLLKEEDISLEIREKVFVEAASSNRLDIVERLLEGKDISVETKEKALFGVISHLGLVIRDLKIVERLLKEEDLSLDTKEMARKRVLRIFGNEFEDSSFFTTILREVDYIFSEVQYFIRKKN